MGLEQQTSILEGEGLWPQETTEGRIQPSRHKTDVISAEFETKKKKTKKKHPVRNVREAPGRVHRKKKKKEDRQLS